MSTVYDIELFWYLLHLTEFQFFSPFSFFSSTKTVGLPETCNFSCQPTKWPYLGRYQNCNLYFYLYTTQILFSTFSWNFPYFDNPKYRPRRFFHKKKTKQTRIQNSDRFVSSSSHATWMWLWACSGLFIFFSVNQANSTKKKKDSHISGSAP